jgi:hypothetical protein
MGLPFPHYVRVKDRYCCHYLGNSPEYVVALKLLKPQIEAQLSGLELHIACRDELYYLLEDEPNTTRISKLDKNEYSYVRELSNDQNTHSILKLMEESALNIFPISTIAKKEKGFCLICPEGIHPVKSLKQTTLDFMQTEIEKKGYKPIVLGSDVHHSLNIKIRPYTKEKYKYIDEASWVIGVENEYLFLGAAKGLKSTLFVTGVGENLCRKMFPLMELA